MQNNYFKAILGHPRSNAFTKEDQVSNFQQPKINETNTNAKTIYARVLGLLTKKTISRVKNGRIGLCNRVGCTNGNG